MTFDEILIQIIDLLQRQGRVSYGALKRRFALDDAYLQDLKDELIDAQRVAVDEDGKVLVWLGGGSVASGQLPVASSSRPPAPQTSDSGPRTPDSGPFSGERRQLTVMFCDLVGSTALSEQLDPEELREVVRAYQQASAEVIQRYEGHIAQYLGDGLLVYFGYPTAHEDDAARAVRTGLEIIATLQNWVSSPLAGEGQGEGAVGARHAVPLQVRIGIHTGLVVVGEMGGGTKREQLALGDTPNIAARLQGLAEPDTIMLSAATHRLLTGLFEFQDLGPRALKGVSTSLSVYRVVRESDVHNRFEAAVSRGLTPLVGREEELGLLRRCWEQAKEGAGQVVLLNGEPGIGKSRLAQEIKERALSEGATGIEFRCSPYHQNSAFYPIIDLLQRMLQFSQEQSPTAKLQKLEVALSDRLTVRPSDRLNEIVPLFASLLSLPLPERYPPLTSSPQKQKQKTQEALVAWIVEEADRQAVYCAWEDLHWADPSTLELLTLVLDQVPTARLLMLLTFRPEFTLPWRSRSHLTQLTVSRLGRAQVEAIVGEVTGRKSLPSDVLHQIITKTDGVPLFVEELTKMVLESGLLREEDGRYVGAHGGAPIPPLAIPSTLQDSLMARLDRLAPIREIAQVGAVLGREFSYELLHAVSPLDQETLKQGLRQLVEAELIYQHGLPPQATYLFKHALIQDTAYQSLLKSRRQQLHQQIAEVLAERFPETVETQPELLAHHYTEASLKEQAIPYWQQAGQRASQRSAYIEAIGHLTRGLELLKTLPNSPGHAQQELALQLTLSNSLMATKGYAALEVEKAYTRALELCRQVGETSQLFPILVGLWRLYVTRADHKTAREFGEQCLSLAQHMRNPVRLLGAHQSLGITLFALGEFIQARAHLEQAIALYDPQRRHFYASRSGQDPGVACLSYAAWTLWSLGYPDQALKRSKEALTLAQELSHPLSLAQALIAALRLHQYSREGQAAQERAEVLITLSTEHQFAFLLAWGTIMRGWAMAEQGQREEGIAQMRQGLAAHRATGAEANRPYYLACLAEVYGQMERAEETLNVLAEALAAVDKTEEREYEAELYRLKGELTLKKFVVQSPESGVTNPQSLTPNPQAEACFHKAITIARKQQAKSLELRAVVSLSRLWQSQGKTEEARQMLAEVYNWFTEGFDTADLKEAKALLEELG